MHFHANAKLGPAGRLALTQAIAAGMSPATANRWWHRRRGAARRRRSCARALSCLIARAVRGAAGAPRRACRGAHLCVSAPHRLGSPARRRRCRASPLDGLEGAPSPRALAPAEGAQGGRQALRVALPGRSAAQDMARYARFERPGHAVTGDRSQRSRNWMSAATRVGYDFAHAIVMITRASPMSSSCPTRRPPASPPSSAAHSPGSTGTGSAPSG